MINKLLFSAFLLTIGFAHGQTVSGIFPPNFKDKVPAATSFYVTEKVDNALERLIVQADRLESIDKMMRFGKELPSNIDFRSVANKFEMPNGRTLYQYGIKSKGALSINLILENFQLAEGAYLFLTDPISKEFIGAYTAANNNEPKVLGTELLKTDEIVVVLDEPAQANFASNFTITTIVHGFDDLETLAKGLNTSGDCHYDVNCPIGAGYELQRNSVAMIVNGGGFCTGSLVNNTSGSIIPYFITARHCSSNPTNWVFRFRWEAPAGQTSCATSTPSGDGPSTMNVNGAVMKATNGNSDFLLVKLNSLPDPSWSIFYNGWDNTDISNVTNAAGIHHPDGDLKKISLEENPLLQQTISFNGSQDRTWVVNNWDFGATEPGSSGSPLFNQQKRLIGVLSGGNSACSGTSGNGQPDYYGRFGYGWDNSPLASGRLKDWLDSTNTGASIIDGVDPFIGNDLVDGSLGNLMGAPASLCDSMANLSFTLLNSGLDTLHTVYLEYGFNSAFDLNYTWSGNLATYENVILTLPGLTVPHGMNTFSVRVVNSNGITDQDISNNEITTVINRLNNDFTAKLALDLDCYGSETSWEIKNNNGIVLYSSPGYADDTQGTYNYLFCLENGCYSIIFYDQYSDGMSGCASADGGNGSFVLYNYANGDILAELAENDANFGNQYEQIFCVGAPTGLGEIPLENRVWLFPNPGTNQLNIQTENLQVSTISVYTVTGQAIFHQIVNAEAASLNTSDWPASFYLIKISTNQGDLIQRWIKQ